MFGIIRQIIRYLIIPLDITRGGAPGERRHAAGS